MAANVKVWRCETVIVRVTFIWWVCVSDKTASCGLYVSSFQPGSFNAELTLFWVFMAKTQHDFFQESAN